MKAIQIGLVLMLFCGSVFSQSGTIDSIKFHYDEAGNRIKREIVYYESQEKSAVKTEIEEEEIDFEKGLHVYPNPARECLFVTLNQEAMDQTERRIEVYDNMGRQLWQGPALQEINQINVSEFPSGTYIVKLIYGKKHKEWIIIKN